MTDCIVDRAKITDYLLDLDHPDGASKAKFFIAGGFSPANPEQLIAALKARFADNTPTAESVDRFGGCRISIDAPLRVPDGRKPVVRSVWKIDRGQATPRLITAYPID